MQQSFSLCLLALLSVAPGYAQQHVPSDAFFLEFGGNGLLYSVNYEHHFPNSIYLRAGASVIGATGSSLLVLPVQLGMLKGWEHMAFDLGLGVVVTAGRGEVFAQPIIPTGTVGVRVRDSEGHFFRVSFSPFLEGHRMRPWAGIGIGRFL